MPFKLPTVHTTKLYMHVAYSYTLNALNEQSTQHCSLQSSIGPYLPCSAAIKFHNITYTPSYHTDHIPYIPSTAHGLHSFCIQARQTISAVLSIASKYIVHYSHPQHNPHPCTSTCTHHTAFHNPLHTTNKHTKHICGSSSKMAQDV